MVNMSKLWLPVALLFTVSNCNLEVGNPENEPAGMGRGQSSFRTLDFQLAAKQSCTTTSSDCTAVPIVLADSPTVSYTFEVTGANLQLSSIELQPYAAENIITQINLLTGTQVALAQTVESLSVTVLAVTFAQTDCTKTHTFDIQGNLIATKAGKRTVVPLQLKYSETIAALTPVNSTGGTIQAAQFDANQWFDFMSAGKSASSLLANLSGGPCTESSSRACVNYTDSFARLVGERISKSLSIKTQPTSQKSVSKGKFGG